MWQNWLQTSIHGKWSTTPSEHCNQSITQFLKVDRIQLPVVSTSTGIAKIFGCYLLVFAVLYRSVDLQKGGSYAAPHKPNRLTVRAVASVSKRFMGLFRQVTLQ